jgi:N-acetyltransferase
MLDLQPTFQTETVTIRPLREGDFDLLYAVASDPLIWDQHPSWDRYQEPVFRQFFADGMATGSAFVILDSQTGEVIGSSRYCNIKPEKSEIEIGYTFFARAYWGNGTNWAVKRLMIDYAFQEFERIVFAIGAQNFRSRRAVEKLGGVLETTSDDGRKVEYLLTREAWRDVLDELKTHS